MAYDIRNVKGMTDLIAYFAENLDWNIDMDDFDDIEDITYDFSARDIGLQEDAFAKISSLKQLRPLVDKQPWGIFCVEFDSNRFEITALRKILSGLVPKSRNSANHAVWDQHDLLFLCFWGSENDRTIGIAHFQEKESGLPQIRMISCAPAKEDFTQINVFEGRLSQLRWPEDEDDFDSWRKEWSSAFTITYHQVIRDASTLTARLAVEAQGIRDRILEILDIETANGYVHLLYEKFKSLLIHDMTESQFADMYAQTVVYGLFSARCMDQTQEDFSADEAIECIPNTNPFLRSLMEECFGMASSNMSFDELEIENVVDLLRNTNTTSIIEDFNRQTGDGREDPVIHFYEEFLAAYDKEQKVQRGVYYTPQPVVNFIVRSIDSILKTEFGIADGMASEETKKIKVKRESKKKIDGVKKEVEVAVEVPAIQILDPATGTGTFIRQTILQIYESFMKKHHDEDKADIQTLWNQYVSEHLLPRINAFELMMAPYAVAHMKLAMVLKDTCYDFSSENRLQVYLTNALEEPGSDENQMNLFEDPLALESVEANQTKKNNGINIILGNPPYSGESANRGEWITKLIEDYKMEPGGEVKLNEKNPKWINDDYVKFIRYAQTLVDRSDNAILGFICPHGFLTNPTFRGMRWNLLQSFTSMYFLDLHGNSNRKETCPDGSKDENVFDIQQGVCIALMIKKGDCMHSSLCTVFQSDLYGLRSEKYNFLSSHSIFDLEYKTVNPIEPYYIFKKQDFNLREKYNQGFSVVNLFPLHGVGITTAHDEFVIADTKEELIERFNKFRDMPCDEKLLHNQFNVKYKTGWDIKAGWKNLQGNNHLENMIFPISYRPFDTRYIFYEDKLVWRTVKKIMKHMLPENVGYVTARSNKGDDSTQFFITENMMETKYGERTTQSEVFPLFIYSNEVGRINRVPNLNMNIIQKLESILDLSFTAEESNDSNCFSSYDVLDYIYAYSYSNKFREKFHDFINIDFPVIPYPIDREQFFKLVDYGSQLRKLHLMKIKLPITANFIGDGNNVIEKNCTYKDGEISINNSQKFINVPIFVWTMKIGGYQPLKKWLKDHKGKYLTEKDILHYQQMIAILIETNNIMNLIDEVICVDIS